MEDLGVFITAWFHADSEDFKTSQFESEYINSYGAAPSLPAYLGYDAIRFIVPLANTYGRKWTEHLPTDFKGLSSDYRFVPVYGSRNAGTEEATIDRYENSAVRVLRYQGFKFVAVK